MTRMRCYLTGCTKAVPAGFRLCGSCRQAVRRELDALPGLYYEFASVLSSAPRDVLQRTCTDIIDILTAWCTLVGTERSTLVAGATIEELTGFLTQHADWLAGHLAAGDFASEIFELAELARQSVPQMSISS